MPDRSRPRPLSNQTMKYWRERLPVPAYDRGLATPGVVHVGVGGFHRAHQAVYLDRLMNKGKALDWGICDVGRRWSRRPRFAPACIASRLGT